MGDTDDLDSKLLNLLVKMDFTKRYYDYYESHRKREENELPNANNEAFDEALRSSSLNFEFKKKENFFSHTESSGKCSITFNIAFRHSAAEFILAVKIGQTVVGGSFQELAYDAGQARDPDFEPEPPYPTLPFSTADELRDVLQFGISLFQESKRLITNDKAFAC